MFNSVFLIASNIMLLLIIGIVVLFVFLIVNMITCFKKTKQGEALIRTGAGGTQVSFDGMLVIPFMHLLERMDITLKTIPISREDEYALLSKDHKRVSARFLFHVRVFPSHDYVKMVAMGIGAERASNIEELKILFETRFTESLKTIAHQFTANELLTQPDNFKEEVIIHIGTDMNGFVLEDLNIEQMKVL